MLHTLGFRLPVQAIADHGGGIVAYPLDGRFTKAWCELPVWRHDGRQYARPRFDSLAAALRALTVRPIALLPSSALGRRQRASGIDAVLMSTEPFGPELHTAIRAWERAARRGRDTATLAPLVPIRPQTWWPTEHLDLAGTDAPTIPPWVRIALAWRLTALLSGRTLDLGPDEHARAATLLADTDGSLLCWAPVHSARDAGADPMRMVRVTARVSTMPRSANPIVAFDARLVRVYERWPGAHNAWLRPSASGHRALRVGVRPYRADTRSPWREQPADHVSDVLAACARQQIELPEDLSSPDCRVRAFGRPHDVTGDDAPLPAPLRHRLRTLVTQALPDLEALTARPAPPLGRRLADTSSPRLPLSTHVRGLHVLCIHATTHARSRMLCQLGALAQRDLLDVPDGVTTDLGGGLRVTVHHRPELLRHGLHDRTAELAGINGRHADDDTATVAWLETAWHPTARPPYRHDARPVLRQMLGRRGVPVLFLHTHPRQEVADSSRQRAEVERADRDAVITLLHRAGVHGTSIRLSRHDGEVRGGGAPPATLVGVHTRMQPQNAGKPARPVLTMIVFRQALDGGPVRVEMHDPVAGWTDYPSALASFHAGPIELPIAARGAAPLPWIRGYVENALRRLGTDRVIILVDAAVNQHIWPGLRDASFGHGCLPGESLQYAGANVAVVRCNNNRDVPQPVPTGDPHGGIDDGPGPVPGPERAVPGRLYRLSHALPGVWYCPSVGTPHHGDEPSDSPAMEIAVARAAVWDGEELAGLAAYLCGTNSGPMQLAVAADREHPCYATDHHARTVARHILRAVRDHPTLWLPTTPST